MKNYRAWLLLATIVQYLTAMLHSVSFFVEPQAANETEKQLIDLFTNYRQDMGGGYHRTMAELVISLSACFTLLFLFGGSLNTFLLKKNVTTDIVSGIVTIQATIFGIGFIVMLAFAFLPPIILTGLVFLFLLFSRLTISRVRNV